jgi:hypothetical protein
MSESYYTIFGESIFSYPDGKLKFVGLINLRYH